MYKYKVTNLLQLFYSSLIHINRLPLERIKIDHTLVKDLKTPFKLATINAGFALAKGLNKETIAEGVEDKVNVEVLKNLGCDIIQGYYFGRPKFAEDFEHYVQDWQYPNVRWSSKSKQTE